jgi:RNase P/RNase MRP subunit POP5
MKLKSKPSAKLNRRYLLIEADNKEEIESTILEYIGLLGWAKASPTFVKNPSGKLILAVDVKELTNIRAAFEASNKKIKILNVSGTLKGLEK